MLLLNSDLVSGRSLPLLVGLTKLPLDRNLCMAMILLGALAGVIFQCFITATGRGNLHVVSVVVRLAHLTFSIFCSLSLAFSIAGGVDENFGSTLLLAPALAIVGMPVVQRHSVSLVACILGWLTFNLCTLTPLPPAPIATGTDIPEYLRSAVPPIMARMVTRDTRRMLLSDEFQQITTIVANTVTRALQIFTFAFYGTVYHGTMQPILANHGPHESQFGSYALSNSPMYSLVVQSAAAGPRIGVWLAAVYAQNNQLHVMLENDHSRGTWNWLCSIVFITTLLFSAASHASQIKEQILPLLFPAAIELNDVMWKRLMVIIVILASMHHQRDFGSTSLLTFCLMLASIANVIYLMYR